MKKLKILQWVPASGKTTWALQEVWLNDALRFNKDDIRKELFPFKYDYTPEKEKIVLEEERKRVAEAMRWWIEYIIIDNTHLDYKDWKRNKHIEYYSSMWEKYNYEIEIKQFYVSEEIAILRDRIRMLEWRDWVGEKVIHKFFRDFKTPAKFPANPTFKKWEEWLPTAIIVDIDWTLSFMDWMRSPYDYSRVINDRFNFMLDILLRKITDDWETKIIVVSWRKSECKKETKEWLEFNWFAWIVNWYSFFMREDLDQRSDDIIKEEIYRKHIEWKYNVLAVFDDRDKVVDKWRELWLPTYQVWYWDF